MATDTYDPAQVQVVFLGHVVTGYADGTFVTVSRAEDAFTLMVGADGETIRSRNNNRSGTITLTLMQSSPSNDVLAGAAQLDELVGGGIGPTFVKDNNSRAIAVAPNSWVQKVADITFAKEAETREWVIAADYIQMFPGGTGAL